jgi:hypothetical protein
LWRTITAPKGGEYSDPARARARLASGHQINLSDQVITSYWSTSRATDGAKGGPNMKFGAGGTPLPAQAASTATWSAPRAQSANMSGPSRTGCRADIQTVAEKSTWPTTTCVHKDGVYQPKVPLNGLLGRTVWPTPTSLAGGSETSNPPGNSRNNNKIREHAMAANSNGCSVPTEKRGALNPEFVCWLMGFPTEWVSCAVSVTRSTRGRRKNLSQPSWSASHD